MLKILLRTKLFSLINYVMNIVYMQILVFKDTEILLKVKTLKFLAAIANHAKHRLLLMTKYS